MKWTTLNTMFEISSAMLRALPEILVVSMEEWTQIQVEFSAKSRGQKAEVVEEEGKRHPLRGILNFFIR